MPFSLRTIFICLFLLFYIDSFASEKWLTSNPFKTDVFIENKGQFHSWGKSENSILFGIDKVEQIRLSTDEIIYRLRKIEKEEEYVSRKSESKNEYEEDEESEREAEITDAFIRARWINSNPNVVIESLEPQEGYFTYTLYGKKLQDLRGISAKGFRKLIARELYPGIDVEYIIPEKGGIKYSLICKPGSDLKKVQLAYDGAIHSIDLLNGDIIIRTEAGFLTEHKPVCFYSDGQSVESEFRLDKNTITFSFKGAIDPSKVLVIDPWVSTSLSNLSDSNHGFDVDLDYQGNLYVYGGGDPSGSFGTEYKVAKYDIAGNLLWTFNGAVPSVSWSSRGDMYYCPSNFLVDKTSGKSYVGQTFVNTGTKVIRIDEYGMYDNFISNANTDMLEIWDMAFNCTNGQIYACGGGMTTNNNFGIIDPASPTVTTSNITGYAGGHQDIVTVAMDNYGVMFAALTSISLSQVNNYIFKVNSTFNGNDWNIHTGFSTMWEPNNKAYLNVSGVTGNGSNVLAVNDAFVYYYDGYNLKAFSKVSGVAMGAPTIVDFNYTPLYQTGVAADNCNNIYVGGEGVIHIYSFNGGTFIPQGTINLNANNPLAHVHDIKYDWSTNSLYVSGEDFVGIYNASQSILCNNLNLSLTSDCSGTARVSVNTAVTGSQLTFTWTDSLGNIIRTQITNNLTDSLTNVPPGLYYVRVQLSPICGGPHVLDSIRISNSNGVVPIVTSSDPQCFGFSDGEASVVMSDTTGYQFVWSTNPPQYSPTATGISSGIYNCTITNPDGCVSTATVQVTDPPQLSSIITPGSTICSGESVTLTVTGSGGTGTLTYSWNTGPATSSITIQPTSPANYSCILTDQNLCTTVSQTFVDVHSLPQADAGPDVSACSETMNVLGLPGVPGNSYQWFPTAGLLNPASSQTQIFALNNSNTILQNAYNLIISDQYGCRDTDQVVLLIKPIPSATFDKPADQCLNGEGFIFTPHSSINGVSYSWNFGSGATPQFSNAANPPLVMYNAIGTHVISLQVTYDGCIGTLFTDSIRIHQYPEAEFLSDLNQGCPPLTVAFSNLSSANSNSYVWDFGDGNVSSDPSPVHTYYTSGDYAISLSAISQIGCSDRISKDKYITVYPIPEARFNHSPDVVTITSPVFNFYNTSVDAITYSWDFGDGSSSNQFEELHQYSDTGNYIVKLAVVNSYGCVDVMESLVRVEATFSFYIPNAFTPNGDSDNDFFQGYGTYLKTYEMRILNRWGREIYHTTDYDKPWDGKPFDYAQGKPDSPAQNEVYVYKIRVSDVFDHYYDYTGTVTLIR